MKKAYQRLWLVLLVGAFLLPVLSQEHGFALTNKQVISIQIEKLAEIRKIIKDADLLGLDHQSATAQLRISAAELSKLDEKDFSLTPLSEHTFVALEDLSGYKTSAEVDALLVNYTKAYPELAELVEVGKSTEQRRIFGLKITSPKGASTAKPSILFNGMHHAREVMSAEIPLDIIEQLLSQYDKDEEISSWLDRYQVYVVPQVNPDGNAIVHNGDRWWRKNAWESDGEILGVDLNRNYPTLWNACQGSSGRPDSQDYRGPSPASEPETNAMMNFVAQIKPVFNISYHSYSEIIIYPFGCRERDNSAAELFHKIAASMSANIIDDRGQSGSYRFGTAPELLYPADGTDLDYQWAEHNVIAYTIEVNSRRVGFQPDYAKWRDKTVARQRGGWKALLRQMNRGGVRAVLETDSAELSYLIKGDDKEAVLSSQRRPLRPKALLYQPLLSGRYRLEVYAGSSLVGEKSFEVGDKVVDLGRLSF